MSDPIKKAILKDGIPKLETKTEYKSWVTKFKNYARAINVVIYQLIAGLVVYTATNPNHVAANDELHMLLVTATKGTWTKQCINAVCAGAAHQP